MVSDDRRSDVPLHDGRLGWAHPHGPVLALRDAATDRTEGQLRRRLRVRHRPRPPRDRHRQRRPAAAQSLSGGGHPLPLPASAPMARRHRRRQDDGQQPDDRSRRRASSGARSTRCRSASSGSWTACSTARWASAARRARAPRSSGATAGVVDGQGRHRPGLLAAEITARAGRDPGEIYRELTREFGEPAYDRVDAPATPEQKAAPRLSPEQVRRPISPASASRAC